MAENLSYGELRQRITMQEQVTLNSARVEPELQYRLEFEALITAISSQLINRHHNEIDDEINHALKAITEFAEVDRSYIFRYRDCGTKMDNTHEWCSAGIDHYIDQLQGIPLDYVPWLTRQVNAAHVVHIPSVKDLPEEAEILKEVNIRQGTQSLLMVPTEYGGKVIGFLGFDSVRKPKTWTPDAIALLRIAGEIFANAIERKRAEVALRQSEAKYRNILETLEEAYWEVDLKGNFTFFSPSTCRMLEYTREDLLGMNFRSYNTPQVASQMIKVFNNVFKTGRSAKITNFEHITRSGKRVVSEMSAGLIRDAGGNPIGFKGVSRDVTEPKRAEQALVESEERYRTVLEANPDPVMVLDIDGRITYFNPAFSSVFGWDISECMGKPMSAFVPVEKKDEMKMMAQQVLDGEGFSGIETQRHTKSGELIPVSISGAVYKSAGGKPIGCVITHRDIREKKKMEQQLLNIHKMESIGTLAGGIAHDFNNLLMAIQGNISLALFNMDPSHRYYEIFENIQRSVRSGARLTSQLLGFARKGRYEIKLLDINHLVKDVVETYARTRKDISIYCQLEPEMAAVEVDEGQIEQVLLNILVNAGQAMADGGSIFVKSENVTHHHMGGALYQPKPGKYLLIEITDTGCGMDKSTMEHIFEPFFTTKEMGRGTGLGLASAYGIIKGHGGYLEVDSEPGHGATFSIYLPASDKRVAKGADARACIRIGEETILLVDDEEMVLDIGGKILERLGYKVFKAMDGQEAIEIYRQFHTSIDLIILDVVMPEMSGSEAYNHLKRINPQAKVLLSSGYSMDGLVSNIMDRGCQGFIQKPFTMELLSTKMREILE